MPCAEVLRLHSRRIAMKIFGPNFFAHMYGYHIFYPFRIPVLNTAYRTHTSCASVFVVCTKIPLTSAPSWTSSLEKWFANSRNSTKICFSETRALFRQKLARRWGQGSRNCSEMGDSSSCSPEGLRCSCSDVVPPLWAETLLLS